MNNIEILSPVGNIESIYPAVRMGADAVYLGLKSFSARNKAANFDETDLLKTVKYSHAAGVKVYVAMNTLIKDDEITKALELADLAVKSGVDAFIIQDMGLFSILKEKYENMTFHASTQCFVYSKYGMNLLYEKGFKRAVLPRELSKKEIEDIVKSCKIETEVFVHGALCVCFSGQCYMSAMLGTRSANRGICAGSCRLPFNIKNCSNNYALSLKDNSLISRIRELQQIGVVSAKIEGRMKRPEYVAIATKACSEELNEVFNKNTKDCLKAVFSRNGFTSSYYDFNIDDKMFGKREKEDVLSADKKTLSDIRQLYKNEIAKIGVSFYLSLSKEKIILNVKDEDNYTVNIEEKLNSEDEGLVNNEEQIKKQLFKTGNTIFYAKNIVVEMDNNVCVKISKINELRRKILNELYELRAEKNKNKVVINKDFKLKNYQDKFSENKAVKIRLFVEKFSQNDDLDEKLKLCEVIYLPLFTGKKQIKKLIDRGFNIGVHIPRFSTKFEKMLKTLSELENIGVKSVWCPNLDAVKIAKNSGVDLHGGFTLNIFNKYALEFYKNIGLKSTELSAELKLKEIEKIAKADIEIEKGLVVYADFPLMMLRNCPAKYTKMGCVKSGRKCKNIYLKDRYSKKFKINCCNEYVEILNCVKLDITDKIKQLKNVDYIVIRTNVENSVEIIENCVNLNSQKALKMPKTSGLYVRGVE